jgi:hypothetical protein
VNIKEILGEYKIHEEQGEPILKGLKILKKSIDDALSEPQILTIKAVCVHLQNKVPLDQAIKKGFAETQGSPGALAQTNAIAVTVVEPPIPEEAVTSLHDYAKAIIPPDGVKQFFNGALDGVDEVADRLTPSNGRLYGHDVANQVASALPSKDEEIRQEIERRLGERKAKGST